MMDLIQAAFMPVGMLLICHSFCYPMNERTTRLLGRLSGLLIMGVGAVGLLRCFGWIS